jgi:asparagine synthase (glutamine-hydrolysing)
MCGIAGVVAPHAEHLEPVVRSMLAEIAHRGPDDEQVVALDGCVLGTARLAVVDVEGGRQPMVGADGRVGVAFNGEVYGHRRLRAGLGHRFRTDSDTELVLAAYLARGARFVEALPGMFAYAVWDARRGRLECARDRFGEKPFFWTGGPDGEVAFASEVSALLATGWVDPVVDETALAHFLRHGSLPPDRSIYRGIGALAPAHRLTVDGAGTSVCAYWSPPRARRRAPQDAADQLRAALDRAVVDQLEADVAVGAFLSGGLDSSTVVALAAEHHADLHTFSFGFGGPDDETAHAERQAAHAGTTHHTFAPGEIDPVQVLSRLPQVWDEPFADASAVPTLLLSEAARQFVTVALTGDGADELLGGYLHWSRHHLRDRGVALSARRPKRAGRGAVLDAYRSFRCYLDDAELAALGVAPPPPRTIRRPTGTVDDLLRFDLDGYLPGDILVKTDRASMSVGLELRSPFLDRDVAELCLSLPDAAKVDETGDKLVLREAMRGRLAPGVIERDKRGFSGPMADWLAQPAVLDLERELLVAPGARVHELVDRAGVEPFVGGLGQATWTLLVLALWAEAHPDARR